MVIIRVRFHKVYDIEPVDFVFPCVLDLEKVPLGEAICTVVVLQVQIILRVAYFHGLAEVSTFESAFKYQGLILILWLLKLVVWPQSLIVSIQSRAFWHPVTFCRAKTGFLAWRLHSRTVARGLLQVVGKVHRVKIVALLVGLLNLTVVGVCMR